MKTPAVVTDILDTFAQAQCPHTGWRNVICGTYQTIADEVNAVHGTSYGTSDIGNGLTWLHQYGPDQNGLGMFIAKTGPGKTNTMVVFDDPNKAPVVINGNVYMRVVDGQALPNEKRRLFAMAQLAWCEYRKSSITNDIIDLGMLRGSYGTSDSASRRTRKALQACIVNLTAELADIDTLATALDTAVNQAVQAMPVPTKMPVIVSIP